MAAEEVHRQSDTGWQLTAIPMLVAGARRYGALGTLPWRRNNFIDTVDDHIDRDAVDFQEMTRAYCGSGAFLAAIFKGISSACDRPPGRRTQPPTAPGAKRTHFNEFPGQVL